MRMMTPAIEAAILQAIPQGDYIGLTRAEVESLVLTICRESYRGGDASARVQQKRGT